LVEWAIIGTSGGTMRRLLLPSVLVIGSILFSISVGTAGAQQMPASEAKPSPTEPPKVAPAPDRLVAAKNLFLKKTGGSEIPYNVINSGFEGWGRYVLVDTAEKADVIMEISAPSDDSGARVSAKVNRETGQPESGYSSSKEFSSDPIKVTVYDAKSKRPLWSATDKPKFAMKQKARENNLVESAERLFTKFHDRVEAKPGSSKLP
jgi:hypothetical protein